jgi:hypothetical protein
MEDLVMHRLVMCLMVCASTFAVPRHGAAAISPTTTFDTVDAVELQNDCCTFVNLVVTGIRAGESTPTTITFTFANNSATDAAPALRCERFAVIAMSKPGKYQFAIGANGNVGGGSGACKLILRTP